MKLALFAALAAAALAQPAFAQPAFAQSNAEFAATTVALSAVGDVRVTPDRATLNLGVNIEAPTAAEAMSQNATRMAAVIAAVKSKGIADRSLRTQGLSLQTNYVYAANQPPRLTGYRAVNMVTVTVDDLDKVGALLDAAVAAGANQVNNVAFALKNPAAAEDQARAVAIKALRAKAEVYAAANGLKVARLVRVSEGPGAPVVQPFAVRQAVAAAPPPPLPIPPVATGEMDVRVQVNAVYELTR